MVHVALLGRPVAQSLSPRMQNAAFAECGLDWRYDAFDVDDVVAAVAALRTLGFAGANVTIPFKESVVAACDEADGDAVNTLVFRDGRVAGFNTDKEILAGIDATRACLIGGGGAATALSPSLPDDTRVFTRSGAWPPDATGSASWHGCSETISPPWSRTSDCPTMRPSGCSRLRAASDCWRTAWSS